MSVCRMYVNDGSSKVTLDFEGEVYRLDPVEAVRMAKSLLAVAQCAATNKENAE